MTGNAKVVRQSLLQRIASLLPSGAGSLFFIQIFSTLSFSVLYSSLFLFMRGELGLNDTKASSITGFFIAFNYGLHLLGGYIGGKVLSNRYLFALGMFLQIIGCVMLSRLSLYYLYWGLAAFLTGSGLNVTCINCMLTQRYEPTDNRREAAFFWNYSGMNIGFFVGFSLSGYFQLSAGFKDLFLISSVGNFIALMLLFYFWKDLKDVKTTLVREPKKNQRLYLVLGTLLTLAFLPLLHELATKAEGANRFMMMLGAAAVVFLLLLTSSQESRNARNKMLAFIVLMFAGLVFWTLYQMVPMGLTLFIVKKVNTEFFGLNIAPQWIQNINTVVIVIGGPLISALFAKLRMKGTKISIPMQFTAALFCIGLGYVILPIGIMQAKGGLVSLYWVIVCYVLQSIGELLISPVGYAMVGRLAPANLQGVMMGTWMMVTGVAATFSNHFSHLMVLPENAPTYALDHSFSQVFNTLGWGAMLASFLLFIGSKKLKALINEDEGSDSEKITLISEPEPA